MKRIFIAAFFIPALFLLTTGCREKGVSEQAPPNVQVVEVIQQDIPLVEDFVG